MPKWLLTIWMAISLSTRAAAQAPPACDADSAMHALDFWIGDWTVVDSTGTRLGDDRVEKILAGCAVVENWHGTEGDEGKSLFYYLPTLRRWKQVWVTGQAFAVGGLKEKELITRYPGGGTRFQGILQGQRGPLLDRTTLTPVGNGRVHQVIEVSRDGGNSWLVTFDAIYIRKGG